MNTDTLLQILQQTFWVGVGVTAEFLETLQDPKKRNETLSELQKEIAKKTQEWSQKGEITEQEARRFVEQWLSQQTNSKTPNNSSPTTTTNVESEIQQLTEKIITLRQELEDLRQQK
jgi:polyhydroxyalkanoate synthesis regulator phasin